jgi:transcriptional regulator with XRE-family HTH domain
VAAKSKTARRTKGKPSDVDLHVGARVKQRRMELGMSQQELGRLIGITFQQLQKNERGYNRLSASRLFETARALDVPVGHFFEGLSHDFDSAQRKAIAQAVSHPLPSQVEDPAQKRETLDMVNAYYTIKDRKVRQQIVGTMRALARTDGESPIHDRPRRGRPPKKSR